MLGKRKLVIKLDDKGIIIKGKCSKIEAFMIAGALLSDVCKKAPKERRKGLIEVFTKTAEKEILGE